MPGRVATSTSVSTKTLAKRHPYRQDNAGIIIRHESWRRQTSTPSNARQCRQLAVPGSSNVGALPQMERNGVKSIQCRLGDDGCHLRQVGEEAIKCVFLLAVWETVTFVVLS
uniref:Uncharacterized protein n=1 Tax=Anopheles culicifacies TaxID=139723 RepID=A0A182M9D7_9DIPT